MLAIVGESGSGKSVTALSLLQLLNPKTVRYPSGKILFSPIGQETTDLLQLAEPEFRKIRGRSLAMIFQEPMTSLNPVYTCGEQVVEAIRAHAALPYKAAKAKTIALFRQVRLPDPESVFNRYPHQLSGGQKQRVMIAMAMSSEPRLLICDEPTTALDVTVQQTILQLLKELQQQTGMGIIFITHDLGVVADLADRVLVLYKGECLEEGPTEAVFRNPQHPYTKALLACRPALFKKGQRLPVVADFLSATPVTPHSHSHSNSNTTSPSLPLLEARHLSVAYPVKRNLLGKTTAWLHAVQDVSFTVFKGETLGLVGESGCGKSTLGRALLRLIEPTSGELIYEGDNMLQWDRKQLKRRRKDLQIVFQDPYSSLNPRITIGDALMEPLAIHQLIGSRRARKDKAVGLLEKVDLPAGFMNRYPHELSGGQRQRVVIARALSVEPGFIVCDESVSALDVSVQAQVLNLLNDLKQEFGFTILFISHDLAVVRYLSDRILVMNQGKIVESGPAEQVYSQPSSDYTRKLLEAIPGRNPLRKPA